MKLKRSICLILAALFTVLAFSACEKKAPAMSDLDMTAVADINMATPTDEQTDHVILDIKNYGRILIRLYPEVAPDTVANFKKLVSQKFYDGLIFHRVIEDFMIQGGDPDGDGSGGSPETIKGEFTSNGFENNLKHIRGVVSMARLGHDPNSASSQFFICQKAYSYGDGDYASFGYVVNGMEIVDKIAAVNTDANDRPRTPVVINSIRFAKVGTEAVDQPDYTDPVIETTPAETFNDAVAYEDIDLSKVDDIEKFTASDAATDYVQLDVEGHGKVVIRLFPEVAPKTVENFKKLVGEGFYNGLTFHRLVKDSLIQGGDPKADGTGGSSETVFGEFEANGYLNNLKHTKGVVSMFHKLNAPDSASSQFAICLNDVSNRDGKYAAFGYVVCGMEIFDAMADIEVDSNDRPKTDIVITSAAFVEYNA